MIATISTRWYRIGLVALALVYAHNALPYLTMLPRVNVDEPWLMERAYQVMTTGVPSQPMLGLKTAYLRSRLRYCWRRGWRCLASASFRPVCST